MYSPGYSAVDDSRLAGDRRRMSGRKKVDDACD
jgi:hypothetical protein